MNCFGSISVLTQFKAHSWPYLLESFDSISSFNLFVFVPAQQSGQASLLSVVDTVANTNKFVKDFLNQLKESQYILGNLQRKCLSLYL